jgi:Cu(I)/Ag(I) efflux system membrane fusion protein
VSRVDGYVQKLDVTAPGELVEKDAPLLSIYSPDLLTSEREFVELLRMRDQAKSKDARDTPQRLIDSAKRRLQLWNVTPQQIAELEKTRKASDTLTLLSPFRGVVQSVPVEQGKSVKTGDLLVEVADLSVVWLWAEFYENELSMLQVAQKLTITAKSYPGQNFDGTISLIDPFLDATKRTAKVRIDIPNPDFKLRPGMYVNAELEMDMGTALTIPISAVMPTGTRSVVFVDKGEGKLEPRIVQLGTKYGDIYEVKSGLEENERVVASANFLIDAESKVQGALKAFEETPGPGTNP